MTGRDRSGGQATVELALVMPVLLLALLAVVQAALVVSDQIATVHAAREAARAVAVDDRAGVAHEAVVRAGRRGCRVSVHRPDAVGATLRVRLRCPSATDVPLVGALLPELTVEASAAMRVER